MKSYDVDLKATIRSEVSASVSVEASDREEARVKAVAYGLAHPECWSSPLGAPSHVDDVHAVKVVSVVDLDEE